MPNIIGAPTLDDALSALSAAVAAFEERGERTLIFCEDKLTLLAERAVLDVQGGTMLTEVTTFARFLSGAKTDARLLSKQGSVMAIASLLAAREGELSCFKRGAARAVYETLAQLMASRVDEELLLRGAEEAGGTLAAKLKDLALLLAAYKDFLRTRGFVDESGYLALLPEALHGAGLQETNVIFFAFPSFTRQAQEGIGAAFDAAKSVSGIFLAGRQGLFTNAAARIFRLIAAERGVSVPAQLKSSLSEDAKRLSEGLYTPEKLTGEPVPTERVRAFTVLDEEEEFSAVAALIKKHVAEDKLRYSDFAVLVQDKESFPLVRRVFSAYHIPYFADEKRPFSEHPFAEFVLNVLLAAADGVLPDEADAVASSLYFGDGGQYRNYLLKYGGYRGAVRREIKEGDAVKGFDREKLVSCRERMLSFLSLFPAKAKGARYAEGVNKLMELAEAERVTEELRENFTGAEHAFLDLSPLDGVLSEIACVSEGSLSLREFTSLLKSGFEALEISMIPQSLDAVFVGDATDSRFARVKVLFATGLNAGLPRASQDTAVISDGEISRLSELEVVIEPAIAEVNARAREGLALNLCSFEEKLYLSCPLRRGGEESEPGEIYRSAEKLFLMPPMPELFPYDCSERLPAIRAMLRLKNARSERERGRFASLAAFLEERGEPVSRFLHAEQKPRVAGEKLYFRGTASPTLLETYFDCPYKGFASRGLRLQEREERTVMATDTGNFMHAVLETAARSFSSLSSEEECRALARKTGEELLKTPRFSVLADTDAGAYTGERLISEGVEVAAAAYRQLAASDFSVLKTEARVSVKELALEGKTDRIDTSDAYVRVIDYKTGEIEDSPTAYYTGRKLQLELYLKAASQGGVPAGAFYFPAASDISSPEDAARRFRMRGFYSGDEEVVRRMDKSLEAGGESAVFDYKQGGRASDRAMDGEEFAAFLDYSVLVSEKAEREMREGNIAPSPYKGACRYCKFRSLCGFTGEERSESAVKCREIARIVKKERGEE